ncbi:unnamed protein product (macronuclear) [Paramecium tetraurelia]|uniref:Uncharacterized protein n=1 Tax=Paramecium tetraurelia TaxID=5888 RepID=A0D6Y4_PARTE|nr:uncharacterized protein GSPATT00001842001 [Paramecium tetraurelia]CAK78801.1 unnamed protein product [Paramecium tetraurelia]|eukprot:XP_001446198.1 hypothetical protein (macronuclear) [Paramecium tetraurelia strain d4-2]
MQILSLLAILCLLTTIKAACELVNGACPSACNLVQGECVSLSCFDFTAKLGDSQTNPFKGTTAYVDGTVDLNITITYTDPKFTDTTLKGITKEENTESCLSLKLYNYQDSSKLVRTQSSYKINNINDGSSTRAYQFTIPSKDFVKQLQISDNGTSFIFHGYYSLDFSIGSSLQRVLYFDFLAGIERTSTNNLDTSFGSLSSKVQLDCQGSCQTTATSTLQFCADKACTQVTDKADLYLNDEIWLKHTLTKSGTEVYYLTNPEIYFTGDKLFKKATIQQSKLNQQGYSLYLIKVEIAWRSVTIVAKATLSSTAGSTRILDEQSRLLQQNSQQTQGLTSEVDCVKDKDSNECIDCDESLPVDNYNDPQEDGCPTGSNSYLIFLSMILVALFI